uniref:Tudor domain containing 7 b n=1 Tax=Takifugu rubripes TaxID=31033 RepID=A0A674P7L8_TAKRU
VSETCELVKKMLRAVLQTNKGRISLPRLQSEYKELTGEQIPHKQMGYNQLDALLASMPSLVHMERNRSGETVCFLSSTNERAHVAKVVARQRSSKKTGRPHLVNTQMRVKPVTPLVLNGELWNCTNRLSSSLLSFLVLRPEKRMTLPSRFQKEVHAHLSRNAQPTSSLPNLNESHSSDKGRPYNRQQVQGRIREILGKYSNGFWVSKLPQIYRELYKQDLPTEAIKDLETWTHICIVEKTCNSNPSELLLYPARDQSAPLSPLPPGSSSAVISTSHVTADKSSNSPTHPPSSPATLSSDLKLKLEELLEKYSNGLWAHALPKLFQDTYKVSMSQNNLHLLNDFCTVDYPMPDNPKRAILYRRSSSTGGGGGEDENCNRRNSSISEEELRVRQELGRRLSNHAVPALQIPKEEYPSVLVVEATNTNAVVLRYIGEGYSRAQESMEDEMREFYGSGRSNPPLMSPSSGQLVAIRAEEEEEILRAQVCEVMDEKVKVHYVDHGFSEVISKTKVFELHEKFFQLPFQASKCKLAGLEPFCQEPEVLKKFETIASGKILLAEILERGQIPLVVLYDTSQDDDLNINAACMKTLQDKTLSSPLQVNSAYMNVTISSVCSDGTIYCQLPSRGLAKLNDVLEKVETYFHSQVTSEFLVSRPFCGKGCLARYKGKWSRVEITNLHGSRVLDILFIDVGVQASVEVFELREIPSPFLRDLMAIPPQAVKCCLADLAVSVGSWTPEAVQWLRDKVLNTTDCSIKVAKVDDTRRCVSVHFFTDKNFHDSTRSLNRQMAQSNLLKQQPDVFLTSHSSANSTNGSPALLYIKSTSCPVQSHIGPPCSPVFFFSGNNMDVYISVACHPGHFVLQPWRDMYKLVVLMGEMILYYNKTEEKPLNIEKNQIYAAKVENNWHRVLVKGVLNNGLVSAYELDYGKHELVSCTQFRPLIKEFRQLPFQAITAQLAGLKPRQWSEEASIVFRNHVEKKPLVAQLEATQEATYPWDRKLTVFLVDTSQEEKDIWVHDIMAEFADELTNEL